MIRMFSLPRFQWGHDAEHEENGISGEIAFYGLKTPLFLFPSGHAEDNARHCQMPSSFTIVPIPIFTT